MHWTEQLQRREGLEFHRNTYNPGYCKWEVLKKSSRMGCFRIAQVFAAVFCVFFFLNTDFQVYSNLRYSDYQQTKSRTQEFLFYVSLSDQNAQGVCGGHLCGHTIILSLRVPKAREYRSLPSFPPSFLPFFHQPYLKHLLGVICYARYLTSLFHSSIHSLNIFYVPSARLQKFKKLNKKDRVPFSAGK